MNLLKTSPLLLLLAVSPTTSKPEIKWPEPVASVVPAADGYVVIPKVAVPPDKSRSYRAIFDATQAAAKPDQLMPALNMAGSELNAFGAADVPLRKVKFVLTFHGGALDGLLKDEFYRAKYGINNPNLKALADLKRAGVKLFVCGQNLAAEKIDPNRLSPDVTVASDALIVLITYQNDGYVLLSF